MRHLVLLFIALVAPTAFACSLTIVYSDVAAPPYLLGDGETVPAAPGVAVELVNEAASSIGCKINWQRIPNRRVQFEMEHGQADAMLMFSFTEERASYAAYPMKDGKPDANLRLTALSYYIYAMEGSPVTWDGKLLAGTKNAVGVNSGYSVTPLLQKLGLTVEEARSTEQNLSKLRMGRISAYVMQDFPADTVIEERDFKDVRKLSIPFSTKDYFLPFSQRFLSASPGLGARLWEQIAKTKKARGSELMKKYANLP